MRGGLSDSVTETGIGRPRGARDAVGLLGILIVAALVRAFAWSRTEVLFNDGPVFLGMAEAIRDGRLSEVLVHPFHPLYPALIALVAELPIGLERAAVAVSILGGLLSVVAIFCFAREAFGRDIGWLSAWVVALHPWAVDFSSDVMSDGLYIGLYLLGFAAMASLVVRPRLGMAMACGLAAGLAYLTRPEGFGLVICCEALLALAVFWGYGEARRRLAAGLVVMLTALIVMAPLIGAVAVETGELSLTRKKSLTGLVVGQSAPRLAPAALADTGIPLPRSSARADQEVDPRPARSLAGGLEAVSLAVRTSLAALRYEIAAFAVLGLVALGPRRSRLREATVFGPALLYTALLVLLVWGAGYVARRHALAALLPICGYAAIGWRALWRAASVRLASRHPHRAVRLEAPFSAALVLVLVLGGVWGARDLRARRTERAPLRQAAEWLAENAEPPRRVAAQKLRVAYYANADYEPLPSGLAGPIEAHLRARGVRWVVIEETGLAEHHGLAEGLGSWLRRVHAVERDGSRTLVLAVEP